MNSNDNNQLPKRLPVPPSMRSNRNLIGIVFYNFCKKTTVHGVNHLSSVRNQRSRIFWIMIVSGAALGFVINLVNIVEKYLQYQVLSNTYHDHELFEFPEISFCNLNPIFVPPSNTPEFRNLMFWTKQFPHHQRNLNSSTKFLASIADYLYIERTGFSHPGWSLISQCRYQLRSCTHLNFRTTTMWPYGNCYTFDPFSMNMTRLVTKEIIYRGQRPSFEVLIYKAIDFPLELRTDVHQAVSMPSGVLVMLHEPQSYPYIFEGFLLDFFSAIDMRITRKFHEPHLKKCIKVRKNFTYIDPVTNTGRKYLGRWADCIFAIIQTEVVQNCNCVMELYPIPTRYRKYQFCKSPIFNSSGSNLQFCLEIAFENLKKLEPKLDACYTDLCTHSSYTMVISQAKYPAVEERNSEKQWLQKLEDMELKEVAHYGHSDLAKKALLPTAPPNMTLRAANRAGRKNLLNVEFVNRNFMLLRIIPQSLFMDKVEEVEEYPISRLLSDIGGCVGLWLGASLITIFELFDLVMDSAEICYNNPYYRYRKLRRRHQRELAARDASTSSHSDHHQQPPGAWIGPVQLQEQQQHPISRGVRNNKFMVDNLELDMGQLVNDIQHNFCTTIPGEEDQSNNNRSVNRSGAISTPDNSGSGAPCDHLLRRSPYFVLFTDDCNLVSSV